VNDSRAELASDPTQVPNVKEEGVDQSLVGMSGGRVDHQAGRLDEDGDIVVLVEKRERDLLRFERGRGRGGDVDLHPLAGFDALRGLRGGASGDPDSSGGDELCQEITRLIREELDEGTVEAKAVLGGSDEGLEGVVHGAAVYGGRKFR
jgi:hypothetical protein